MIGDSVWTSSSLPTSGRARTSSDSSLSLFTSSSAPPRSTNPAQSLSMNSSTGELTMIETGPWNSM
ncbi:MAG: hypothetical protein RAK18_04375 [Conexivisphaerales archaeon]|nr:hypothetical protein [Conexivisphaerales archaeon]